MKIREGIYQIEYVSNTSKYERAMPVACWPDMTEDEAAELFWLYHPTEPEFGGIFRGILSVFLWDRWNEVATLDYLTGSARVTLKN